MKQMQKNWIGRSEGYEIDFHVDGMKTPMTVFTSRPETLYGVTHIIISTEHPLLKLLKGNDGMSKHF